MQDLQTHEHDHHHHEAPAQDWLKTILLLGLGTYFVYLIAAGNLTNYINVRFSWLSYVAAILFLLLGVASFLRLRQPHEHQHHDHDHDHASISWGVLAIVAIPLVMGTLLPSRPLGASAVDGDLSGNNIGGEFQAAPEDRNILDWVRAFHAAEDPADLDGLPVDVVGFVYQDPAYGEGQFLVARFTISCCVADSMAIGMPVVWDQPLEADTWIQVQGQLAAGDFQGDVRPIIQASSISVVDQPEHPYLYP